MRCEQVTKKNTVVLQTLKVQIYCRVRCIELEAKFKEFNWHSETR